MDKYEDLALDEDNVEVDDDDHDDNVDDTADKNKGGADKDEDEDKDEDDLMKALRDSWEDARATDGARPRDECEVTDDVMMRHIVAMMADDMTSDDDESGADAKIAKVAKIAKIVPIKDLIAAILDDAADTPDWQVTG